jgi:hypothetical protein
MAASSEYVTITGAEQIGWDQELPQGVEPSIRYRLYVDRVPADLNPTCRATATRSVSCQSPLPKLSRGRHHLELTTSFLSASGTYVESPRSPVLNVFVGAPAPTGAVAAAAAGPATSCAGIVAGSDDRAFAADAASIWRVRPGRTGEASPAIRLEATAASFLALALDPAFQKNGYLYALTASGQDDRSSRLALIRYRDQGNVLGERTVLFDGPTDARYSRGRLRFDAEGMLYVGAWVAGGAPPPAPPGGIVMRLNGDGKVPANSPERTGVVLRSEALVAFDIDPEQRAWVIEESAPGRYTVRALGAGNQRLSASVPINEPPSQMTIGVRSLSGPEMWVAFDDRPPVQILRSSGRGITASPASGSTDIALDLAFTRSGTLLGCGTADPAHPSGPRVFEVRAAPALSSVPRF